jgi:hypothetical protein
MTAAAATTSIGSPVTGSRRTRSASPAAGYGNATSRAAIALPAAATATDKTNAEGSRVETATSCAASGLSSGCTDRTATATTSTRLTGTGITKGSRAACVALSCRS